MWTSIYIARNKRQADALKSLLDNEGILVNARAAGTSAVGDGIYEIQVLESEVDEAQMILCQQAIK